MLRAWMLLILLLSQRAQGAGDGLRVIAQPQLAQRNTGGSVAVMCQATLPIQACMFRVQVETELKKSVVGPMDFVLGPSTPTPRVAEDGVKIFHFSFFGAGLESGGCGLQLTNLTAGRYFVGCRVRSADFGWVDDFTALVVHTNRIVREVESNKTLGHAFPLVTLPNVMDSKLTVFAANGSSAFNGCKFFLPHQLPFILITSTTNVTDTATAHNVSLVGNECHVALKAVGGGSNGLLWCLYRVPGSSDFRLFPPKVIGVMERVTAKLNVTMGNVTVGDTFTATCSATRARPPAVITWSMDGRPISEGIRDDVTQPWTWPWELHSSTQVLMIKVAKDDLGKEVTCLVAQPAGGEEKLVARIKFDPNVCVDGFFLCNWLMILVVAVAVFCLIVVVVFVRRRRDWRWS